MIRSASRHSKSANDAYIRGDHAAAHHFSVKAQQEWAAAERLNAKAAKEILDLRNCKNDPWTLDLHGLHAAEAVKALHEHLMSVETLLSPHCLEAQQVMVKESSVSVAASAQSSGQLEMEKFGRRHPTSRQRITLLQVITGMCQKKKRILWNKRIRLILIEMLHALGGENNLETSANFRYWHSLLFCV